MLTMRLRYKNTFWYKPIFETLERVEPLCPMNTTVTTKMVNKVSSVSNLKRAMKMNVQQ